ncbi:DUF1624 domain-containing protein [Defluviimonas sp. WL0024]|uniref:DUF1624 domain-containing protein n=2 Tax=Albidovulum salinarum TaxID=2984153 RepID=A0ABT2X6S2_9RHOB|nr:DUF1624 domain-containing protein [Defluviimonas sp. WL0024]
MEMGAEMAGRPERIATLDIARTLALVGMAVFHFTFDLQMFGHLAPGTTATGGWVLFARLIAGSFLFLAGVSLQLAHGRGIRPRAFGRRFLMIAGAALLVTGATYMALPEQFVYFGILHSIAVASVIGLAFLRLPALLTLAAAAAVLAIARMPAAEVFEAPWLHWLGLATTTRPSVDFVPVFPWLAPCLVGIALARLAGRADLWDRLRRVEGRLSAASLQALAWPGRHSLAIYLIHQPVLYGLVWAATVTMR